VLFLNNVIQKDNYCTVHHYKTEEVIKIYLKGKCSWGSKHFNDDCR